jgi:hydroxymethylpyrimidine pyrophosphatase-like HAD family hydrolase
MPLLSNQLSQELLTALTKLETEIHPFSNRLNKNIYIWVQDGNLVYKCEEQFYFHHIDKSIEETFLKDIQFERQCLVIAFEIDGDYIEIENKLRQRFAEQHGQRWANMIESLRIIENERTLLLMKLPAFIVRHLMCQTGGTLESIVKNKTTDILATQYVEGAYELALSYHWENVKKLIASPNHGTTILFVGRWTPNH